MNKLEMEQKLLRLQINPHFIFNSLNSIKGYILQNNPDTAALYLDKFAKLMRMILENAAESELPFEEDIHILQLYLELEQKRFPGKFDFSFDIDETIDTERTYIIPMLIQPFVENSIKHGFKNLKRKGNLIIKYEKREKFIVCTIIDNGTGRINEKNTNRDNKHKSMGIKLTSERLSYATNKTDDYIRFFDLKDDKGNPIGTKVEIFIPYSLDL
jgi:LytS/YehU family sensor histidine kinase